MIGDSDMKGYVYMWTSAHGYVNVCIRKIEAELIEDYSVRYDETGSIGKRYRRLDEAGTPFCITVDFDTIETDDKVTIRYRDNMSQKRIPVNKIAYAIKEGMMAWKPS